MNKRTLLWLFLLFLVLGAIGVILFFAPQPETAEVKLPSVSSDTYDPDDNDFSADGARLEITPDNVQAVIMTLKEQETYSRSVTITRSWSGGSKTSALKVRKKGNDCSIDIDSSKSILICDGTTYISYGKTGSFYSGASAAKDALEYTGLIDFTEVLSLDKSFITEAEYTEREGDMCIFVRYNAGLHDYTREYYVSIKNGVLMQCTEFDENGNTVYEMISSEPDLTTPTDDYFTIPS